MTEDSSSRDYRLLFLPATSRDASSTTTMLSPLGIDVTVCRTFDTLLDELGSGAGAILVPEELASAPHNAALRRMLARQPPWSDLPVLIRTRPGADAAASSDAVRTLGNVTLLERPVRVATLGTAIRTALRARACQYQIREHLEERARSEASLRMADARKEEFLATLGHELRNPLAPLVAAVQLLKITGSSEPRIARALPVMERQLGHLRRLVNDLVEVSRITRGLIELRREPIELPFVMHAAIETSRPALDAAGHQLLVDLPAEPMTVHGDAVRLTQVFSNLLNNAAKYTNAGGHIWLHVQRDGDRARVSVRDDGIGIAPDQLASVFEVFTQVDRSNRRGPGGLGIGLTLVRSLVALHGGTVEARSQGPGSGCEFIVTLPMAAGVRPLSPDVQADAAFPHRRVLIVDDNDDAANTLGELLTTLGATVSIAHSGHDVLDAVESFDPDVVVLDLGMPEMDGYEVARRIRASPACGDLLLIALTGWGQEHDRRRSLAAGFDHHIVKPADLDQLRTALAGG